MISSVSVLGSTGSIGRQSLRAAEHLGLSVKALAARSSVELLERQARQFKPELVGVVDETAAKALRVALADTGIPVLSGEEGLIRAALLGDAVVTAVSGSVGLRPTLAAIEEKKRICLANKETLVCAGEIVMARAAARGAEIVPVDSEHSAIFQCLEGRRDQLRRILLTGSGGPFRGMSRAELADVTPARAVAHPNWSMGAKISVDSATMMNKGLEFIEAMHLFAVKPADITVVVHPQSVIHSMVELVDGTVLAQLAVPDMGLPIQYAMTWPERAPSPYPRLDWTQMKDFSFEQPDFEKTPCLALAIACAQKGGSAPAVMSAANEAAVARFLRGEAGFNDIYDSVAYALEKTPFIPAPDIDTLLALDREARVRAVEYFG